MRVIAALLIAAGMLLTAGRADACAGCRNPNLPVTRLASARLLPGQLRASALLTATSLNVVHEAGCADVSNCSEVPVQPRFMHDQNIQPGELRAVAELGLTPTFGLELQLPFRITRTTIRYTTPEGAPYQPLDPEVHHRNETVAGLGDPWLLARAGRTLRGATLSAAVGTTIPLGRTEVDPFALGAQGLRHQHIQMGNGTFDPLLALDVSRRFGIAELSAYGQAQLTLYQNGKGFRAGNRFFGGAQAGSVLPGMITAGLGLDVLHERPERWQGKVQQDGNLGRTELLAGAYGGRAFGRTHVTLVTRIPVYRHIVEGDEPPGRLSSFLTVSLIVSRSFGGPG